MSMVDSRQLVEAQAEIERLREVIVEIIEYHQTIGDLKPQTCKIIYEILEQKRKSDKRSDASDE